MTSKKFACALNAVAFAFIGTVSSATAQALSARPELALVQIRSALAEEGFRVLAIERDDGWFEVKALDASGACVELDVDRRSGEIVRSKRDDDCRTDAGRRTHVR